MPRSLCLKTFNLPLTKQTINYLCLSFFLFLMVFPPVDSVYGEQLPQVDSPFSLPADFDPSAIEAASSGNSPTNKQRQENVEAKGSVSPKNTDQPEQSTKAAPLNTQENVSEPPKSREPTPTEISEKYVAQAMEFYKKGNLAKAEALFARAAFNDQGNAKLWNNLGLIRRKQEKIEQAIAAYERAIQVDPGYALAYKNLAVACEKQKDYKKAARSYLKYAELAPSAEDSRAARKRAEWLAAKKP
ncbi:tetratricopeptide repeat protein [Dethiosulfatarculus sandiegensis]|uniref:Uncharacterized protein n=1 Tax=Dethiosulfatarculus sandiegensis TaxID=1429043 RepID=A0A0D2JK98_9BACT|nr:tetratricopeptide repeat protein [Dethiosulfatarculus sandiegensis]KIX16056.1 hypothetical protein X474_00775 [Dethiosulfatarculus sandiegensis]